MFTPLNSGTALLMMVISAICWGSWANTYKGVKNYRFELFYWDYAVGIFLMSLLYAFTMGSSANDPSSFLHNVRAADLSNIGWALLAGVIFNLANLLLVAAIDMAGLAIAFPIGIGIALVVGTVLSYVQQQRGFLPMLDGGRGVCGRCSDFGRQGLRRNQRRQGGRVAQEHCHLHRFRRVDGAVGAIFHSRAYARAYARSLQHRGVPHRRCAAFLLFVEYLLHEETAGGRACRVQGFLSRADYAVTRWDCSAAPFGPPGRCSIW